jgi:hypothetical protein
VLQTPLTGELIETVRASSTPLTSVEPIAETHEPFVTSDADEVLIASYVVALVVLTVVFAPVPPNNDVSVNDDPLTESIVPNAPPPNPPRKPPPTPPVRPGKAEPVGRGRAVPPVRKPPAGGVPVKPRPEPPNPPKPPAPCWQPEVLVTVTLFAVTFVGIDGVVAPEPPLGVAEEPDPVPATVTQSPLASDDRVVVDVDVNRVCELKSTVDGPLVCCTEALLALAAMTLPETALNDVLVLVPPVPVVVDAVGDDPPPPQPATRTAHAVPPTAMEASRGRRREIADRGVADTVTPLIGAAYSVRSASIGASFAARVAG